ncbi:MAG: Polysaccharide biosynthesis/export protein, partial [Acidobacteriota bacterium]|nr:Polysaccharide biosynthesis/export protein [Acidobacteriota bacterium]
MKKFFYFAAVALAFCVADARAAVHFQVGSVRVGPASDEAAAEAPAAPTPKKDEKKVKPAGDRHGETARENQDGRSDGSGEKSHGSDKSRASDKTHTSDKAHISDKAQEPASLSNSTASTNAPPITSKPSATSDAPLKPGTDTNVPVGSPVKTTTGAEATSDSNKIQSSSTTEPTANTANPLAAPATAVVSLASVYRIGIGDVLDIRMLNGQDPRQSTLYPVLAGGVLDFPLLHDPLTVTGMTTDELAAQLIAELRHRNINDRPQVRVSVREYASHAVLVSG